MQRKKYIIQLMSSSSFFLLFALISLSLNLICPDKSVAQSNPGGVVKISPPISIEGLRLRTYDAALTFEKKLQGSENINSDLYAYFSDGLKIYALVQTSKTSKIKKPLASFPVLIFGHGFHPEPKKYGVSNETGKDWRPGDYYRGLPAAYAEQGFIVITPDYRGHNKSDGFKYTQTSYLASSYYAIDVLYLISALSTLPNADTTNIFYMGHSMGGDVGLKMLTATNKIKAASIWSGVSSTIYEQAIYYGKSKSKNEDGFTPASYKKILKPVDSLFRDLNVETDLSSYEPIHFIKTLNTPLIIHHATEDPSVPYIWSESLVARLYEHEKEFLFYSYDDADHLFKGADRAKAVERDVAYFGKW